MTAATLVYIIAAWAVVTGMLEIVAAVQELLRNLLLDDATPRDDTSLGRS